jgi:hypothetical protein
MGKRLRRILLVVCAAFGLFVASTLPAQAVLNEGQYSNLRVVASGSPCFAPQSNSWGAAVHAVGCSGSSNGWQAIPITGYDSRGGAWYVFEWLPDQGCLVPNWTRVGAPVVVSGPCGNVTGGDYAWYAWPESNGHYELVNGGNTSLVLDLNAANGSVQVWTANYGTNQQWWTS